MFTIDTNILISYLNDDKESVKQLLGWRDAGAIFFISVITEIEALSLPSLTIEEINRIQQLLREFTIISLDSQLGQISAEIRRKCRLSLGDSIVVATAKLTNSILATKDKEIIKKAKNLIQIKA